MQRGHESVVNPELSVSAPTGNACHMQAFHAGESGHGANLRGYFIVPWSVNHGTQHLSKWIFSNSQAVLLWFSDLSRLCRVKEEEPFFFLFLVLQWLQSLASFSQLVVYWAALPYIKNAYGTFSFNILSNLVLAIEPPWAARTSCKEGLHPESVNRPHLLGSCLPGLWEEDGENLQTPHRKVPFWHRTRLLPSCQVIPLTSGHPKSSSRELHELVER